MRRRVLAALGLVACLGAPSPARAAGEAALGKSDKKLAMRTLEVALMRDGRRTVETLTATYEGPIEDFFLVVPVPVAVTKDDVKTLVHKQFEHIDALGSPRLDELWEKDPCGPEAAAAQDSASASAHAAPSAAPSDASSGNAGADSGVAGVKVEAAFPAAEYDVSVLSASDSSGLDAWLHQRGIVVPEGGDADLAPYAKAGWRFVVVKVDVKKIFFVRRRGMLSPLRIAFDTDDFKLPLRPALLNSPGSQDLIVHVLARGQRYEPASYASILADTNVEVTDGAKAQFAPLHEALVERALARNPRGFVTEFAGPVVPCDGCSASSVSRSELLSFGADVIPPLANGDRTSGFVLTRLHARYAPEAIVGDLELRPAPPIAGGRELRDATGEIERGAHPSDTNDFRTRYVVRHPWTVDAVCDKPHRGVWGGYPGGLAVSPMVAHSLGFVDPTKMELGLFLRQDLPDLDLHAGGAAAPTDAGAPAAPVPTDAVPETTPSPARSGCGGCALDARGVEGATWWGAAAALGLARRRRKRDR